MVADHSFLGTGWSFPPSFSTGGAEVATVGGAEDVHQSLQILLATQPGERIMQEPYGVDLDSMLFEEVDFGFVNRIKQLVSNAILRHEPRVELESVDVRNTDALDGRVDITIAYTVRSSNSRFNMVYPFYVDEARAPGA